MKRKLLSILLTLCLAFSLLPTAALADGTADPEAQIGEKTYATLKAAFEEAKDGDTVTLLKDVETNNIEDTVEARIIIDKAITLNLNDKTIRTPDNMGNNNTNFTALIVDADVIINATTGGINTGTNGGYGINVLNGATLTINGGTYYGGGTAVQVQKGTLIINDGHFSCEPFGEPYGYKYLINCIDKAWKNETAKVFIKGGIFVKFDPSNSASENPNGNFLAEGYGVKKDGDNYIVTEPVAAIGDTKYPTLAAAITAANNNTVTLLKDVTGMAVIPSGTTVTIDLSGRTITRTVTSGEKGKIYPALYVNGGTLTLDDTSEGKTGRVLSEITDTTVSGAMSNAVYVNGGTFTLKNGALAATAAADPANNTWDTAYGVYVNKSTFTMENGSVTVTAPDGGAYGIAILGPNGVFTMNDGAVTADGFAISGNGSSGVGDTEITINKGTVTGGTLAIYHPQSGELKINGGTLTGKGGIETKAGDTTVSIDGNPTIVATGTPSHNENNNGNSSEGYAISVVENKNYAGGAKVSIASGYYKGEVRILEDNEVTEDKKGSIIITGGLFTSDPSAYCAEGKTGVASGNSQYPYTVGDKDANAKPAHVDTATVPAKTDSNSEVVKKAAEEIKGAEMADPKAAEAAAKTEANQNKLTGDTKVDGDKTVVEKLREATGNTSTSADNVAIVYQTYVDVVVSDATADSNGKITELEVNLTPMYRVVATAKTVVEGNKEIVVDGTSGVNAVIIEDGKKLTLPEAEYEVRLNIPSNFVVKESNSKVSIKHTKDNGQVEYYTGTVIQEGGKTYVTFTTKGFSPFTISAPAASIGETMYPTLAEAVANVTDGQTIQLEADCAETVTVSRTVKFTLKTNSMNFTGSINPGSRTTLTTSGAEAEKEYTFTYSRPSSGGSSSGSTTYTITVDKSKNGSVTVSPKSASKGDTVTVTVKPDSGYVLETLTVTDKNGNELTLKDKGNGKYTFTMPAGKVEVKATFMEDNSMLNFFYDVPNNAYFYEAVKWAVKNGITTGVGNDLFAPEQPCTRAQIVTFLWRAAGSPEPKGAASGMTDVVSGSYYEKAVAWAIENGITTGTTTTTFSPDATCTRAQAVTFLARALKAKAASAAEFSDVPTGSYFADAVAWAAANGVTEGIGGGLFGSDNDCTRGQIVTFLYRAYNK